MNREIRFTTGTTVDKIFDTYLDNGVRPYAQIGFMPEALSSRPRPLPYQYAELESKGQLQQLHEPVDLNVTAGRAEVEFELPRAGVSLLEIEF